MRKPGNIARYLSIAIWALIAFCSLAFGQTAANRWSSHGPYGGAMSWFAIAPGNPNLIYAARADTNDVFKSVDGGVTWAIANSQMPTNSTDALTFDPANANTIYAAATDINGSNGAIYKTTNGGVNWIAIRIDPPNYAYGTKLIVDPPTSALYVVGGQFGSLIFQSVDGGANWNVLGPWPGFGENLALAIDPNNPSILYVAFTAFESGKMVKHLYKSTDRGATWHKSDVGIDINLRSGQSDWGPMQIAVARGNSELIYAAMYSFGDIFRSTDGGAHWNLVYTGPNDGGGIDTLVVDPINQNVAYAGTRGRGVLKTTDGGATWSQFNTGLSNTFVYGLAIDPANGNHIFAATNGPGAFSSTNGGANWNELSIGQRIFVQSLATTGDPGVVYAGGMSVFKSTNAGASWTTYPAATTSSVVNSLVADPDNGNVVYALMQAYSGYEDDYRGGGSVFKSTDGGVTWSAAKNGLGEAYVTQLVIDPQDHNTLYAGTWNGTFKSTDAGASWNMVRGSVCCIVNLAISPANNRTMYASAWYGDYTTTIFKTTDGGANWANIGSGLPDYVIPLAVDPKNPDVVYTVAGSIYRSNDGGVSWSQLSTGLGSSYISELVVNPNNSNDLFAAQFDYAGVTAVTTIIRSTDGGASWSSFGDGFSGSYYTKLAIDRSGQYLHVGTSDGVFSIEISPSISPPNQIDNAQFFVRQHYLDFLGREPDQAGWDFWTNEITSCGIDQQCLEAKDINVSASFFLSIEFQRTGYLAYRFYKAAYGNLPGAPVPIQFSEFRPDTQRIGLGVVVNRAGWETVLENNQQAFASEFVQRSRFTSAYPASMTPKAFVQTLFANAGVIPTASDLEAAVGEFAGAMGSSSVTSRARALRRVAENSTLVQQEFNRAFVLMQYFGYLRRNPNDTPDGSFAGYDFWLNKLNQFNGDFVQAEMVKAFIESSEYRRRFGQ